LSVNRNTAILPSYWGHEVIATELSGEVPFLDGEINGDENQSSDARMGEGGRRVSRIRVIAA
jgi:hypothetical protein